MCGIFALLNNYVTFTPAFVEEHFELGKNRGPELSKLSQFGSKCMLGFHRLAINGLNAGANQPIIDDDIILICNGEIYNYRELYRYSMLVPKTESDCEVIIHLYKKYGIDQTLQLLDGVFSFILIDNRSGGDEYKMYIARDPYGVRPLYALMPNDLQCASQPLLSSAAAGGSGAGTVSGSSASTDEKDHITIFASELKVLYPFYHKMVFEDQTSTKKKQRKKSCDATAAADAVDGSTKKRKPKSSAKGDLPPQIYELDPHFSPKYTIVQFLPGTYSYYTMNTKVFSYWSPTKLNCRYHTFGFNTNMYSTSPQYGDTEIVLNIQRYLIRSIEKRCHSTERPMACLLSGGLDSSIITGLVWQYHVSHELPPLETYSIGLETSEDIKYARIVANHLKTKHTEIIVTEDEFISAIPEVIQTIESYDTTTVRASIGNYLIGKYISQNSHAKVIFNGDGSDELLGGYLYMYMAPESVSFDCEVRRLLNDIYMYDVLRSDKSISSHGLEPRTPFLDRSFVQYYLSIPHQIRFHTRNEQCEKYYLRLAFCGENYRTSTNDILLPNEVLWRTKEAFSDGVSGRERSLFQIIQDFASNWFTTKYATIVKHIEPEKNIYEQMCKYDPVMQYVGDHLLPQTAEQYYYRWIFENKYPNQGKLVPYFWMPRFVDGVNDPSARTLDIYGSAFDDSDEIKDDANKESTKEQSTTKMKKYSANEDDDNRPTFTYTFTTSSNPNADGDASNDAASTAAAVTAVVNAALAALNASKTK